LGVHVKCFLANFILLAGLLLPIETRAQGPGRLPHQPVDPNLSSSYQSSDVEVTVRGADGIPIAGQVVVELIKVNGKVYERMSVKSGRAKFTGAPKGEFTVLVTAPGYQRTEKRFEIVSDIKLITIAVDLRPESDVEEAASGRGIAALTPKGQKDVGKALEALRANKPNDARNHLESAQRDAPYNAEIEYLFGVYSSQMNDPPQAQAHWRKTLAFNPNHLSALLALSQSYLHEHKPEEAIPYLNHAAETEPSSWRAQSLLAEADYMQEKRDNAIQHAERAIELGHERAASVRVLLARALAEQGEKERAIQVLQDYVKTNPSDATASNQLQRWQNPQATTVAANEGSSMSLDIAVIDSAATALPIPSNWLPPDIDEKIPAVEAGANCSLDDVLTKAGNQIVELVHNVDRFTATESLMNEDINKWGIASPPEKRRFDYVVSIQELRQGYLGVDEFRNSGGNPADFPDGIVTNGLPALILIFHPFYAPNYEMTCEGMSRSKGKMAWQVHFRQRPGKPVANKAYKIGQTGPSYPVALKGRAWISADDYQIVRMETDLVAPLPEIRLVAEHTTVEYGSVSFRDKNVSLWLPQSAEVFFDWKGRRIHRRHSFSDYLLFAVEDKQHISAPKGEATEGPESK
jgi:tetratricopeptide (TPR) repeat protein